MCLCVYMHVCEYPTDEKYRTHLILSVGLCVWVCICMCVCMCVFNRRKISYASRIECGYMCVGVYVHVCMCVFDGRNIR